MIKYNYEVSVNENRAKLNKDIFLFRGNRNIHYYFSIKGARFTFSKENEDLLESSNAIYAAVTVVKPNGVEVANAIAPVEDGLIHLKVTEDLIDEEVEVGDFDLVFDLFDDNEGAVTIPKIKGQFHVQERPCTTSIGTLSGNVNVVNQAVVDLAIATQENEQLIVVDDDGKYVKTTWVKGDKISIERLNKIEEGIEKNSTQYKDIAYNLKDILERLGILENYHKTKITSIPYLYLDGDTTGMSKETSCEMTAKLVDVYGDTIFEKKATIAWQGNTSLQYDKKNYSIKLKNEDNSKYKHKFELFPYKTNSYHLKANYVDASHARNIVTARIAHNCYPVFPGNARCVIEGFPFVIVINNKKKGLYTWNLKQGDDLFGMDKTNPNNLAFRACTDTSTSCCMKSTCDSSRFGEDLDFEEKVPGTYTSESLQKLNRALTFISTSSDTEFHDNMSQYFDIDTMLTFRILCDYLHIMDLKGSNYTLCTWDGNIFYWVLYDMDTAFGKKIGSETYYNYDHDWNNTQVQNNFWNRVDKLFKQELYNKYLELKPKLRADIIKQYFIDFKSEIADSEFTDDVTINPGIQAKTISYDWIYNWIEKRVPVIDKKYDTLLSGGSEGDTEYTMSILSQEITVYPNLKTEGEGKLEVSTDTYDLTDYIDISEYKTLTINKCRYDICTIFDENKTVVSHIDANSEKTDYVITLPSNAKYIRLNIYKAYKDTFTVTGTKKSAEREDIIDTSSVQWSFGTSNAQGEIIPASDSIVSSKIEVESNTKYKIQTNPVGTSGVPIVVTEFNNESTYVYRTLSLYEITTSKNTKYMTIDIRGGVTSTSNVTLTLTKIVNV